MNLFKHKQVYLQLAGLLSEKDIPGKMLTSRRLDTGGGEYSERASFSPRTPEEFADGIGADMFLLMVDGLLG